ncbi:MAG: hypothetical protein Fur005_41040 [Roseiflexaceae bacterium]
MSISYRPITTHAEYRAAETIQQIVWGRAAGTVVPDHMLLTAQKNGGLLLGAFDSEAREHEQLIGIVFGILGLSKTGKLKHCSHLLAVLPEYTNQRVGEQLKWQQRTYVLAQGIDWISWTYDPIESRNAHLNIHKLGAVCQIYWRDLYGSMTDGLNAGLPSDRFEVDWHLNAPHVVARSQSAGSAAYEIPHDIEVLNPAPADPALPAALCQPPTGSHALIRFPSTFQQLKTTHPSSALAWRLQLRELCEMAFAQGYQVVGLQRGNDASYYLIARREEGASL